MKNLFLVSTLTVIAIMSKTLEKNIKKEPESVYELDLSQCELKSEKKKQTKLDNFKQRRQCGLGFNDSDSDEFHENLECSGRWRQVKNENVEYPALNRDQQEECNPKVKHEPEVEFCIFLPSDRNNNESNLREVELKSLSINIEKIEISKVTILKMFKVFEKCERCKKLHAYEKNNLRAHARKCVGNSKLQCDLCAEFFCDKSCLAQHLRTHYSKTRMYKCNKCAKKFTNLSFRKHHQELCKVPEKKFNCDLCPFAASKKVEMEAHMVNHFCGIKCNDCGVKFSKSRIKIHKKKRKCFLCSEEFFCQISNDKHVDGHKNSAGWFDCSKNNCNKSYQTVKKLRVHVKYVHASEKLRTCQVCAETFASVTSMKIHTKVYHSKNKNIKIVTKTFQCDLCSFENQKFSRIRYHMKIHRSNRERLFACDSCDFKFLNKWSLVGHFQAKPRKCLYCDAEFRCAKLLEEHSLKMHRAKKTRWPCHDCEKVFRHAFEARAHQKYCRHGLFATKKKKTKSKIIKS